MGDIKKEGLRKILVLGSTGVGKSAFCYNLGCNAKSSNRPTGVTLEFDNHFPKENKNYQIIDACGFNEGSEGSVSKETAIRKFFNFFLSRK